VLDVVALFGDLLQGGVHSFAAEFRNLDALDDRIPAVFAGHRVAVDHALRDAVAALGSDAHRHPVALARAADPVAHVVDRRVGRARRRGEAARVDDRGAALLDGGNEGLLEPGLVVDHRPDLLAVGLGLEDVRILRRRVVSPDGDFSNRADGLRHLVRYLRNGPVMVEAHHAGELRRLKARRVFHRDEAVGVRRVADDQHFHVSLGDLVERSALRRENPAVRLEQVLALHAGTARARADQQRDVDIAERDLRLGGGGYGLEKRNGAVVEVHTHALQRLLRLLVRDLEQLQDHRLVPPRHLAPGDADTQQGADIAGGAGHGDAYGDFGHGCSGMGAQRWYRS